MHCLRSLRYVDTCLEYVLLTDCFFSLFLQSYICSICDPEVEEAVTYPIAIHDYLSADVRDRIEFTSCAVMYMIDGMALLRGTSMSVTKAVSILESTILTAGTDRAANTALHVQPREFNIDEELSRLASRQNSDMGEEGLCSLPESVKYHLLEQMAKEMTGDSVQLAAAADSTLDFSLENHASDESSPDPSLKAASSSLADSSASAIAVALEAVEVPTTTTESNTPLTKPSSALAYNFTNPPKKSGLACNFTNPPKKSGLACNFTNPPKKSGLACNFTNPPKKSGLACNFTNPPTKSGLACNFSNPPKKSVVVCNSDNTPKDTSASPSLLSSQPSPLPEAASSSVSVDVAVPIVAAAPLNTPAPIVTAGSSRRSLWSDPVVESLPAVSSHIPFPAVHTESAISSSDTSGTQPFPKSDSGYPEVPHISKATMPAVFSSHSSHTSADVDSRIRKPDDTVSQATLDTSEESDRLAGYPEHIREADRKERERKKHQEQLGLASQKQGRPSDGGYQPHSRPIQNLPGHRQKHQPSPQHGRPPQYSHSPQRGIPPHSPAAIPGSHTSHPAGQHHRGNQRLQGYRTIFRSVSGVPGTPRPIVIDGSNVARRYCNVIYYSQHQAIHITLNTHHTQYTSHSIHITLNTHHTQYTSHSIHITLNTHHTQYTSHSIHITLNTHHTQYTSHSIHITLNTHHTQYTSHSIHITLNMHHTQYASHSIRITLNTHHTQYASHSIRITLNTHHTQYASHSIRITLNTHHTQYASHSIHITLNTHHTQYTSHSIHITLNTHHTQYTSHSSSTAIVLCCTCITFCLQIKSTTIEIYR